MNRRQFIAACGGSLALAGCTGGGPGISVFADNEDSKTYSVAVWAVQGDSLEVADTVAVAPDVIKRVGEMRSGHGTERHKYRVTVKVDGELSFAQEFQPDDWFTTLTVRVKSRDSVGLKWGRSSGDSHTIGFQGR